MNKEKHICQYCGREHSGAYGSGRFCGQRCARGFSSKEKRLDINKAVSKKLKGRSTAHTKTKEAINKQRASLANRLREKRNKKRVKIKSACIELDITNEELDAYRSTHKVCEICGKEETLSLRKDKTKPNLLCVDHDHSTNTFRGLLCHNCNSRLGWYENHKKIIDAYLLRTNHTNKRTES